MPSMVPAASSSSSSGCPVKNMTMRQNSSSVGSMTRLFFLASYLARIQCTCWRPSILISVGNRASRAIREVAV